MTRTDYAAHDGLYQQRRAAGLPGWDTAEDYREREAELAWAVAALGPTGPRLLELGCGAGNGALWFATRGFTVTGIDISPTAVAWATERAIPRATFHVGDLVEGIAGEYDVIVDSHCLHCIIGADRARLLANAHRALAPGGKFFTSTMCGEVTGEALRACFDLETRCQVVDGIARRYIGDAAEILDELRAAGFVIEVSTIDPRKRVNDQDNLWAVARA